MDSQVMKSFRTENQFEDRECKLHSKKKSALKNIALFRKENRNGVE